MATELNDEQWVEARRLFDEHVEASNVSTLSKEKRDTILELLCEWEDLDMAIRKERSKTGTLTTGITSMTTSKEVRVKPRPC